MFSDGFAFVVYAVSAEEHRSEVIVGIVSVERHAHRCQLHSKSCQLWIAIRFRPVSTPYDLCNCINSNVKIEYAASFGTLG